MKIFRELIEETEILVEESEGKKTLYLVGPVIMTDHVNINKRNYPGPVMEEAVNRYVSSHIIGKLRSYGELGHPNTPKINLERVSHMFTSLVKEGKNYIGKAKIIDTPYGNIARSLISEGAGLGFSSRCVGDMEERNGITHMAPGLKICTPSDIVADPSAAECFGTALMEDKEWVFENDIWREVDAVQAKQRLSVSKNTVEEQIAIFEEFISGIAKHH